TAPGPLRPREGGDRTAQPSARSGVRSPSGTFRPEAADGGRAGCRGLDQPADSRNHRISTLNYDFSCLKGVDTFREALRVGTPVLISDRTPWRNLADVGIGWDLPLSDKQAFADCLEQLAALSPEQYYDMRIRARQYASDYVNDTGQVKANENLFVQALQES